MATTTAVHGNSIVPGPGVTVSFTDDGAIIRPDPLAPGMGVYFCSIPNPANAPVKPKKIKINDTRSLANTNKVELRSGNVLVSTDSVLPGDSLVTNPEFSITSTPGNDDDGWNVSVTVEFLHANSFVTVRSLAIFF